METEILLWTSSVTRCDHIRNEYSRDISIGINIVLIVGKLSEKSVLAWTEHIIRTDPNRTDAKICLNIEVIGK